MSNIPAIETTVFGNDYTTYRAGDIRTLGATEIDNCIITAEWWPAVAQDVKDRIETDVIAAGWRLDQLWSVEYQHGNLQRVTVVVGR